MAAARNATPFSSCLLPPHPHRCSKSAPYCMAWEAAVQPQVTLMRQVLREAGPLRASSPHGALKLTKPSTGELRDPVFRKRISAVKVSDIQERPCFFFPGFVFFLTRNLCSPVKKIFFTRESIQDYIIHRTFLVVKVIHTLLESQLNSWSRLMTTPKQS